MSKPKTIMTQKAGEEPGNKANPSSECSSCSGL